MERRREGERERAPLTNALLTCSEDCLSHADRTRTSSVSVIAWPYMCGLHPVKAIARVLKTVHVLAAEMWL